MGYQMQRRIDEIERDYNANFDVPQGCPQVSYTEYNLLALIKDLYVRVEQLEAALSATKQPETSGYFEDL